MTASEAARRRAAEQAWARMGPTFTDEAVAALGPAEADAFLTRVEITLVDVHEWLAALYGGRAEVDLLLARALRVALAAAADRPSRPVTSSAATCGVTSAATAVTMRE